MLPSGPGALFGSALVITSYNPLLQPDATVCAGSYYGSVGRHNFFWVNHNDGCAQYLSSRDSGLSDDEHTIIQIQKRDNMDLFWLEREAVEQTLFPAVQDELSDYLDQLVSSLIPTVLESQIPIHGPSTAAVEVLERSLNTALVRIDPERIQFLDIPLPSLWKGSLLSRSPLTFLPVPSSSVKRVQEILRRVKFDPVIASIVNNVSIPQLKNDVRFLTGEDEKSGIQSRHSFSDGILVAAEWIKDRMSDTGAHCELKNFLPGFGPNIICSYPSSINTTETVLLSAHYDSRGSFGSTRAPGADDDGSGTVSILGIARTIARRRVQFESNVQLCLFAGEEQGLLGSRAYARELRAKGANLTLMIQADMLAYHAAGEPPQLGLPDLIGTPEVTQLVANISAIYSPELVVGFTPACCSDHQSFHEQGFPATQVFERAGPIADPMYHNSGDLSDREGYDFGQIKSIAKVQFATLLHSAGFTLGTDEN